MSKIYLARHGETTWNVEGRYQGRLESQLSDRGNAQAAALAAAFTTKRLSEHPVPTRIISSPLLRCRNTAQPFAQAMGIFIQNDDRLIEIAHGSWEGLLRDEIIAQNPQLYRLWREKPSHVQFTGGETLQDVADRWKAFALELAMEEEDTLVVSHDAVIRIALLHFLGRPLDDLWNVSVENAAFAVIERLDGKLVLHEESHVSHLADLRASIAGQAL